MLVGERMSRPVISVTPEMAIHDVLAMFKKEHIRRAPVIKTRSSCVSAKAAA